MVKQIGRRILFSVPLLFLVATITFFLTALIPGNIARTIVGQEATKQQYIAVRNSLGLNQPLLLRYWHWLDAAIHGNLGQSLFNHQSVASLINVRLQPTLSVVFAATFVSTAIGVTFGVASALRPGRLDRALDGLSALGLAIPPFFLGLVLVEWFAVKYRVFPAIGYVTLSQSLGGWFHSLVLPVVTLSVAGVAVITKQTRDAMRDVMERPFVRTLKASGISSRSVIFKHALRNASIPVTTVVSLVFIGILSGTVLVETVFAVPGLGGLAVQATQQSDIPLIQGIVVYFTLIVIIVNLVVDVLYVLLNPKVRAR
jgi:peptide/nickel transport system permease protein